MAKKEPKYTTGRATAATTLGAYHSAVAAKPGKKVRATGRTLLETTAGGMGGSLAGVLATRGNPAGAALGSGAGSLGGAYHAFRSNNKKGYYKPQKIKKNFTVSAFGVDHGI